MPIPFHVATAEQVLAAIDAVLLKDGADAAFVATLTGMRLDSAKAALALSQELGLLTSSAAKYSPIHFLAGLVATANESQKAAVLRIALEGFAPFLRFRERLATTTSSDKAADHVRVLLDLDADRDSVKETLISLGTYSSALRTEGGGRYRPTEIPVANALDAVVLAVADQNAAVLRIREQLGADACDVSDNAAVVEPLARALMRAKAGDGRASVTEAGNALESYLVAFAGRKAVNIGGAHGINSKLDRLKNGTAIPTKLSDVAKSLGHTRNAADHGVDAEVGAAWAIHAQTGMEYVFSACSIIRGMRRRELGHPPEL